MPGGRPDFRGGPLNLIELARVPEPRNRANSGRP
jgi:hypothetical protein